MKKLKLATIAGTRPELIKLSEVIKKADRYFDHIFVHTGQNYDERLNDIFYDDLSLRKPDEYLNVVGENLGHTMGNVLAKSYDFLLEAQPDALLILGDTNSALCAVSAKRLKIPIFHMEAGNRCFDENLPEEINRKIIDHISDVNLPYSEFARKNLLAEGLPRQYTFVTGSPMREVLDANQDKIEKSKILDDLSLEKKKYIILSAHREENIDNEEKFFSLMNGINEMAETYKMPVIYSVHPRSRKYIEKRNFHFNNLVREMPPFSFSDYVCLQKNAFCVVSDSGTLAEESSILGFPSVSIRTSTERQEAIECAGFTVGGVTGEEIIETVDFAVERIGGPHDVADYKDVDVSEKVVSIIQSYTNIINRNVWGKRI